MSCKNYIELQKNMQDLTKELNTPIENGSGIKYISESPCSLRDKLFCSPLSRQIQGTCGSLIAVTSAGMVAGFSATLLPQLQDSNDTLNNTPNETVKATPEEASWIASVAVIFMALGSIIIIFLMKRYGRRQLLLALSILEAIGWMIIAFSNSIEMLYIGRFVTGLYVGLMTPVAVIFVAETTDPKLRGVLLSIVNIGVSLGVFLVHLLGTLFFWKSVASVASVLPLLSCILMSSVVESPTWFLTQKKIKDAENSFRWFRGFNEKSVSEFEELISKREYLEQHMNNENDHSTHIHVHHVTSSSAYNSKFVTALLVMLTFFLAQQFSGFNAIIFYTITVFKSIGNYINEYLAMLLIDFIRVLVSIVSCILMRKYGRRSLAVSSGFGTSLALTVLGILYFVSAYVNDVLYVPILIVISFIIYICAVGIGLVSLPWVMIGEVFPVATREIGSGLASCFGFLMFFVVVKTEPKMLDSLNKHGLFFTYSGITAVATLVLYKFLPETKNRTLQSIEDGRNSS